MANKDQKSLESIYHKILIRENFGEESPEAPFEAEGHGLAEGGHEALEQAAQGLGWLGQGEHLTPEQLKAIEDAIKGVDSDESTPDFSEDDDTLPTDEPNESGY